MPTHLVYDCFSGISGDMHLGAMVDLGVPLAHIEEQLARLGLADEFELSVHPGSKLGISGSQATVRLKAKPQHHRHLRDITAIIDAAELAPAVTQRSRDIFQKLAEAEAKVHGISIDEVHFHEVGATDAIVDVVAAAVGLEYLAVEAVYVTGVELGAGTVRCAHGLMPVPAPATAELVAGLPCRYGGVQGEATTPTGAAILKHAVTHPGAPPPGFRPERTAYGLGQKDFELPNALRVMLGTAPAPVSDAYEQERNLEIQCNIDDMTPEAYQPLLDELFRAGARDVFLTPIIMKKSRPGTRLTVLGAEDAEEALLATVFAHSSTIGVRVHAVDKRMLPRETLTVDTSLGAVSVKRVRLPDGQSRWKLEHDVVTALAARSGADYLSVRRQLEQEVTRALEPSS